MHSSIEVDTFADVIEYGVAPIFINYMMINFVSSKKIKRSKHKFKNSVMH